MGTFFAYSIQSALCLAGFYLFYKVLFSRDTFHRFNRIALLGILILSLIIPCILSFIPLLTGSSLSMQPKLLIEELTVLDAPFAENIHQETPNVFLALFLLIYLTGCFLCLIYTVLSVARITRIIHNGKNVATGNGTKLVLIDNAVTAPFSWMKFIIITKSDYEEAGETILAHETAHIHFHHSLDLVIAQFCIITQWFNPAIWLLYKELQTIHEFEADEAVINTGINAKQYQLLLIKKAVGTRLYAMANSLNHSNLKKRITMMLQRKSSPWARLKYAYVLPLAATAVVLFAQPEIFQSFDEISNAKVSHFSFETMKNEVKNLTEAEILGLSEISSAEIQPSDVAIIPVVWQSSDDSIFVVCDKLPEYHGGEVELINWIGKNLVYPPIAHENRIQGRVVCTLVVEKDGSVTNVEVVKGRDPFLDKEAVRVLKQLPRFKPGENKGETVRVRYNLPITFKLLGDKPEIKEIVEDPLSSPPVKTVKEPLPAQEQSLKYPPLTQKQSQLVKDDSEDDYIFTTVEKQPEFPGGEEELFKWLRNNLVYPKKAAENGIQGRVNCQLVIEKDGSITDVEVVRGRDPYLDAEAVRVLKKLPKFIPGEQRGQRVRVRYSLPVVFSLQP